MNKDLFKFLQNLIKIIVGLGLIVLTIHIGLLLYGINEPISEWLFGFSIGGASLLFISSYVLKLCTFFRLILVYDFIAYQCILLQRNFQFFDSFLYQARLITFIIGLILTIKLIYEQINK